jgi:competence protein ComEA
MKLPTLLTLLSALIIGFMQLSYTANANNVDTSLPAFNGDMNKLDSAQSNSKPSSAALVNINDASAQELSKLPGLGAKKAKAIIEYRELNGQFTSVDELVNVKGIGPKMLAKLQGLIIV